MTLIPTQNQNIILGWFLVPPDLPKIHLEQGIEFICEVGALKGKLHLPPMTGWTWEQWIEEKICSLMWILTNERPGILHIPIVLLWWGWRFQSMYRKLNSEICELRVYYHTTRSPGTKYKHWVSVLQCTSNIHAVLINYVILKLTKESYLKQWHRYFVPFLVATSTTVSKAACSHLRCSLDVLCRNWSYLAGRWTHSMEHNS